MLSKLGYWWRYRQAVPAASKPKHCTTGERDIVVIPCWRRAEFLWHCLENLTRNPDIDTVHVLFRVDTGYSPETLDVIATFADRLASYEIDVALPSPFRRTKPSANFLFGMLKAAAKARRYVFLVEEDIMVGRDFLRWHREVQALAAPLFCSIPVRNPNRTLALPDDVEGYYLSSGDSCSNGMCFDKDILLTQIAPHFNMSYLRKPKRYLRRQFPDSRIGLGFVEQDGLIRRIQERSPCPIAWPCVPRAFHAGFFGARGGWQNFAGSDSGGPPLNERIKLLTDTIYSADAMRKAIDHPEFLQTCMPSELALPPWEHQRRVPVPAPEVTHPKVAARLQGP